MADQTTDRPLVFFIHVMKTGGMVLDRIIRQKFPAEKIYPRQIDTGAIQPYVNIDLLRALSDVEKSQLEYLVGHIPYCVGELFHRPLFRIAFFRNPVQRVISHLRMAKEIPEFEGQSLSNIYANDRYRKRQLLNLQCRYFAHNLTDDLKFVFKPLDLTLDDLERAKQRVLQCSIIGLLEDYERSFALVAEKLGLPFDHVPHGNASVPHEVPDSLLNRIIDDNEIDMRFYEFVAQVYRNRSIASCSPGGKHPVAVPVTSPPNIPADPPIAPTDPPSTSADGEK